MRIYRLCTAVLLRHTFSLQPCLHCLPETFLETLHMFIRVRRGAVALHLHSLGTAWLCLPFDFELSRMASSAANAGEALYQKSIVGTVRQVLMSHLGNEVGSRETKRNNYKHGSVWWIPFIINLPLAVTAGCNIFLVVHLISLFPCFRPMQADTPHVTSLMKVIAAQFNTTGFTFVFRHFPILLGILEFLVVLAFFCLQM